MEELQWLEDIGCGIGLIHDDGGLWAVLADGMQTVCDGNEIGFQTTYMTIDEEDSKRWKPTAIEAIRYAMENWG